MVAILLTDAPLMQADVEPWFTPEFQRLMVENLLFPTEPLLSAFRNPLFGPDGKRLPSRGTVHGREIQPNFVYTRAKE